MTKRNRPRCCSCSLCFPAASVGLILGVYVLLSSAFMPVIVLGNSLATIVVGRMERAIDLAVLQAGLRDGPDETAQSAEI